MLVVSPIRLRIQPIGWRGCEPRITAPSIALPIPAMFTSGHPWIPSESVENGGYDAVTSTVSATPSTTQTAATVQATWRIRTSAHPDRSERRQGRDHVGASRLVRADREVATHRVDPVAHGAEPSGCQHRRDVEPLTVVAHEQRDPIGGGAPLALDPGGAGVLDGVLHRLDAAEVQRRLELDRVPADPVVDHRDRDSAGAHD